MLNSRTIAMIFGFIFIAVSVFGFTPNPLVSPNGIFVVNLAHNLVHLITGFGFFIGLVAFEGRENRVIQVIGLMYLLVAILGFFTRGDMLLGMVHINQADRWLHLGLAVIILAAGFLFHPTRGQTTSV